MKTQLTGESVSAFLGAIADPQMREDCRQLTRLMEAATKSKARIWGKLIGFGSRKLRYANGKEVDWMLVAFAPRTNSIALYLGADEGTYAKLKDKLGKHKQTGKGCVHVKSLADVDLPTLKKLVAASVKHMSRKAVLPAKC